MTLQVSLKIYNSPQTFLDAISPAIPSQWEWRAHAPLGFCRERVQNPAPLDNYVATWVGDSLQILIFRFHGPESVLNISSAKPTEELQDLPRQLQLLADWAAEQPSDVLDLYTEVDGPEDLVEQFTSRLTEKLEWPRANLISPLRGSYVDRQLFISQPKKGESHVLRQCTTDDNVEEMAKLVQAFQRGTSNLHPIVSSLEDAVGTVRKGFVKGSYWGYFLEDGRIAAMAMLRRPTANGIRVTLVVADDEFKGRGYGTAVTSAAVEHALDDLGKTHVTISWEEGGRAGRIYTRLGFSMGYRRNICIFNKR